MAKPPTRATTWPAFEPGVRMPNPLGRRATKNLTRFGLVQAGTIEERPGIPPTPAHLTRLIGLMKAEQIKVVIMAPWGDQKLAERVAQDAGAKAVTLATGVGAVKGTDTYVDMADHDVKTLAQGLR